MKMRERTMASQGFNGFVLPKMFRAIFYLFCDVTGPNGHFSTWFGEKYSFRKIRGLKVAGDFTGSL
jgi:hypothetical protein